MFILYSVIERRSGILDVQRGALNRDGESIREPTR